MVSMLDSGSSGQASSPDRGHWVVLFSFFFLFFLCCVLGQDSASLHPGVKMSTGEFNSFEG